MTHITDCFFAPGVVHGFDADPVPAGTGLFEGTALSPRLFALVIDGLARRLRTATDRDGNSLGIRMGGNWLGGLLFVDDVVLLADTAEHLRMMIDVVMQ